MQNMIRHFTIEASLFALILLLAAPTGRAGTAVWTAAENSNLWDAQSGGGGGSANNWTIDSIPDADDVVVFDEDDLVNPIRNIHLNGNRAVDAVIFQDGGQFTLGTVVGAETLTIGEGSQLSGYSLASSAEPGPTWNVLNCNVAMNDTSGDNTFKIQIIQNHELTIRGVVSGSNALRKEHNGTLILTNANTYSGGTTINFGTVRISNPTGSATGTGAVTVQSEGILSGTGRIGGAITANAGGIIAPGNSIGTLTALSGVTLNGTYACEIGGSAADRLAVTGTLNVRNGTLNVSQTSPWTGTSFTIATATQVLGPFATVTGLPAGYSIVYGSTSIVIRPTITFHVDAGAAPGGAGTNWITALDTLDEALALSGWNDRIWVKEGVYVPGEGSTDPYSTFDVPHGVQLLGGFAGTETSAEQRDPTAHLTVLSGDLGNDDTGKVNGITTSPAGIQGTNTYSVVRVFFAAPVIDGFTITGGSAPVTPIGNPGGESRGGGVFVDTDFARVPTLSNCRLFGNSAVQGGAIFIHSFGGCNIVSCDFRSNRSSGRGGAAYYWWSNVRTTNSNFSGNIADDDGGAIFDDPQGNGSTIYVNCTFTGNSANDLGGAIANSTGATSIRDMYNTVIWNNRAQGILTNANSSLSSSVGYDFTNCLVQHVNLASTGAGNLDGTNLAKDPDFVVSLDPALAPSMGGNFRPSAGSPIIDVGANPAIAGVSLDLSGELRIIEGTVDLGAYEYLYPPAAVSIVPATTGPTNASSLAFTIQFSEDVTNFNALADLVIGTTGTANATGAGFTGSGSNYTVTLTGVSGDGTLTLAVSTNSDVRDLSGNLLASSVTSAPVTMDHTPPAVTSITPATTGPTNVASLSFAVQFSEAVVNFDALADLVVGTSDTVSVGGASFSGSGSSYTVTLTGVGGDGTLTLTVSTNSDVRDLAGNLLVASVTSPPATLDHSPPDVTSVTPAKTGPTSVTDLAFAVQFSEAVVNFDALADLVVGTSGTVSVGGASFSGTGSNYIVTLTDRAGEGTLTLAVATNSGVQDVAGNALASTVTSAVVTFLPPVTPALLHWPLEEGSGTNTFELASGGNVAFLTGPVTWTGGLAPGSAHAIDVNIDSPNSSYVDAGTLTTNGAYVAGSDPGYRVLQNNWSITAWVRLPSPQGTDSDRVIASSDTGGGSTWWLFFVQDSTVQENLGFDFNSTRIHSGLSLPLNQTVFVAITADNSGASLPGGTNKHQFAVWDGTSWQTTLGTQFSNIRLQGLEIGSFNSGTRQFDGVIDDVRIYDQTLTQADLDALVAFPPVLSIVATGSGQAQISWTPETGTNWVLQETSSLSPTNWLNSTSGSTNPIVVPAIVPTKFYRLFKQ